MIKIEVNGGIKRLDVSGDERALSDKVCAFGANLIKAAGAAMKELDEIGGADDDYRGDQEIG